MQTIEQVNDMDNPFQMITDTFHPDYRVNLSIQGLDGSIMLTLSNECGVVAKRLISAAQRNDPQRLRKLIESVQFGIAIERGDSAIKILAAMTDGATLKKTPVPANGLWPQSQATVNAGVRCTPALPHCAVPLLALHRARLSRCRSILSSLLERAFPPVKPAFRYHSPFLLFSKSTDTSCYNNPCAETFERLGTELSATAPAVDSEEATCTYVMGY